METIADIKRICWKQSTAFRKRVFRESSYYFTWLLLKLHFTGNQVSVAGLLLGLIAAVVVTTNNLYLFLFASLLLFLSEMADYCDGEVARYRKHKGLPDEFLRKYGMFFDSLNHVALPLVLLCMSFSFIEGSSTVPHLILLIGFSSAFFNLFDSGLYSWLNSFLRLMELPVLKERKSCKIMLQIRAKTYNAHVIPFWIAITATIDILFKTNLMFYLWLYFALIGCLLMVFKFIIKKR